MRKLFKGGNYSRAETIWGNTVYEFFKLLWIQKRIVAAATIWGNTVKSKLFYFQSTFALSKVTIKFKKFHKGILLETNEEWNKRVGRKFYKKQIKNNTRSNRNGI